METLLRGGEERGVNREKRSNKRSCEKKRERVHRTAEGSDIKKIYIYTVEPLLIAEPTFSDQNTNYMFSSLKYSSDVSIENIARLK